MNRNEFMILHSEMFLFFQCIENDLKLVYAGMRKGDFGDNLDALSKGNLGKTIEK